MAKCVWCGKTESKTYIVANINESVREEMCSDSCKIRFVEAMSRFDKYKKFYLGGIIVGIFISVFALIFGISQEGIIAGMTLITVGITIVLFPYTTPETTHFLGMRKASLLARLLGGCLAIWGLSLML